MSLARLARRGVALGGDGWYSRARESVRTLAREHGTSEERAAAVLALTSPRVHVSRNYQLAKAYLASGTLAGVLPMVRSGLAHYERTGEIRGPKVSAFARALLGDPHAVVLDVWILRALGVEGKSLRAKEYERQANRVRRTAKRLGMSPAACQAAIWAGIREKHNRTASSGEMR